MHTFTAHGPKPREGGRLVAARPPRAALPSAALPLSGGRIANESRLRRSRRPTRFISRGCATHRGSALHEPPTVNRLALLLGRPVVDSRSARDSSLPGKVPGRSPSRPRQRMRPLPGASCPRERPAFEMGQTRPRFRRGFLCPAPPVGTPTSPPLPCSTLARPRSAPTRGTLPVVRHLKHEVDQDLAPVTTPAAADLPRLVMDVPRSVPSLAGVTPRAPHRMSRAPARA